MAHIGFKKLVAQFHKRAGVTNPGGLAHYIGVKKYGAKKMAQMAAKGRRKH